MELDNINWLDVFAQRSNVSDDYLKNYLHWTVTVRGIDFNYTLSHCCYDCNLYRLVSLFNFIKRSLLAGSQWSAQFMEAMKVYNIYRIPRTPRSSDTRLFLSGYGIQLHRLSRLKRVAVNDAAAPAVGAFCCGKQLKSGAAAQPNICFWWFIALNIFVNYQRALKQ